MFVNKVFRSIYFWVAIGGLAFIVWGTKGNLTKIIEIFKLLWKAAVNILAIVLGVALSPFIGTFQPEKSEG